MSAVRIVEVGPRDGLQNESHFLPTNDKIQFVQELLQAGLPEVEVTSFVRPESIPQMRDASQVYSKVSELVLKDQQVVSALVPNEIGLKNALISGVKRIALFSAASESFCKKNVNATIDETFERFEKMLPMINTNRLSIRAYISTVFGCPYEGAISESAVENVVQKFLDLGASEVSLGDTIGAASPIQVEKLLTRLLKKFPADKLAMHFHDTQGLALVNIWVSYQKGIRIFDSSAGGLGGCPYAPGSTGNVATENVVTLFESIGVKTGVDLQALARASRRVLKILGKNCYPINTVRVLANEGIL